MLEPGRRLDRLDPPLLDWLALVADDPLAFCLGAFPWGEPGVLEKFSGPLAWQAEIMADIKAGLLSPNQAIQLAVASGHGVGKSALVSMITLWAFFTSPDTRGIITANTETQLRTKTWAELGRWFNLCDFARDHFILNATSLVSKDPSRERTWRIDMIAWSENNPEAFAGLHNRGRRQLIIFDEASNIADKIWETVEGATTDSDTEIIWLAFGNPTRNTGRFRECFPGGAHASMWHTRQLDSRSVEITNLPRFAHWAKIYGEDSDWFRVRVRGVFPRFGEMEFFSGIEVDEAMSPDREVYVDARTPLALGVDVARFGKNSSVLVFRRGRDARSIPPRRYQGIATTELSNHIHSAIAELSPDGVYVDGGGVGGGVVDQLRQQRLAVTEIQFGGKDDITGLFGLGSGEKYANKRSAMYGALRAWLPTGMLPLSTELRKAMLCIQYTFNRKDEIQLVSKEDLLEDNPDVDFDELDALACTFGGPIAKVWGEGPLRPQAVEFEYDPFSPERMAA